MPTPIYRQNQGTVISVTTANAIASAAYSVAADKLTISNASGALMADFELDATFGVAPVAGTVQLVAVDYSLDGATAGAAPTAALLPRLLGTMNPIPGAGNTATAFQLALSGVSVTDKMDVYIYNNATGQSIGAGAVLKCQLWTPGT